VGGKCEAEHSVIHSPLIVVHLGHLELPIKKTSLQICNINTYAYIVGYKDKHKLLKHSSCAQPTHKKKHIDRIMFPLVFRPRYHKQKQWAGVIGGQKVWWLEAELPNPSPSCSA
jgi:hypothetical protein